MLYQQLQLQLDFLLQLNQQLTTDQYTFMGESDFESSIGKHTRHILEFFQILQSKLSCPFLCYENRARNHQLENSPELACEQIKYIHNWLAEVGEQKIQLQIHSELSSELIESSFQRELLYMLDHSVHHFAVIRIFVEKYFPAIQMDHRFGFAPSTLQFNRS